MIITKLLLNNFRNHASTELAFGDRVNVLIGNNGQGKTNVLEGISYLSLTKSIFGASDSTVLQFGKESYQIQGNVLDGTGRSHDIEISYRADSGQKRITVDSERPASVTAVVGKFPIVVLSPDHGSITSGGPAERRKFVDILLSQVSRAYLEDLLEYRRILRQRNKILAGARTSGRWSDAEIEPWTEGLCERGGRIVMRRSLFVKEFQPYVRDAYATVSSGAEVPAVTYVPTTAMGEDGEAATVSGGLLRRMKERQEDERRRGMTLVGPHRDELRFTIDSSDVQGYASQGQHKTLLVAMKVAEFFYMQERRGEPPAVLLDDVFSELDPVRARRILGLVPSLGQTLITATDEGFLAGAVRWDDRNRRFRIERGECAYV